MSAIPDGPELRLCPECQAGTQSLGWRVNWCPRWPRLLRPKSLPKGVTIAPRTGPGPPDLVCLGIPQRVSSISSAKAPAYQPINDSWSKPLPSDSTDEAEVRAVFGPSGRAIASASELAREGERVSLNAACKRAGVDGRTFENVILARSKPFTR